MGATSIHVQAVKPGSEIHNFREKELDYVRPELSHLNESWVGDSISHRLESAKQRTPLGNPTSSTICAKTYAFSGVS